MTTRRRTFLTALALSPVPLVVQGGPSSWAAPRNKDVRISEIAMTKPASRTLTSSSAEAAVPAGHRVLLELPARSTDSFSTLGATWAAHDGVVVAAQYRTRSAGSWSGWQSTDVGENVTTADGARHAIEPLYVGVAEGVEIRLTTPTGSGSITDARVVLIDGGIASGDARPATLPESSEQSASGTLSAAAASSSLPYLYPRPSIVSRKGWGADESWRESGYKYDDTIRGAIVHHTAGVNSYSRSEAPSIVRGVYAYHTRTLGWSDIGYNFLIDKYGTIYEGRAGGVDRAVHGAHATDWNTDTVGISFMGNFETATPPAVMIEAAAKLLAWKLEAFYVDPQAYVTLAGKRIRTISGHRDVMSTACPGRNMYSRMGSFRSTIDSKIGSFNTPIYRRWKSLQSAAGPVTIGERKVFSEGRWTQCKNYDFWSLGNSTAYFVTGRIREYYNSNGKAGGALGFPTSDQRSWPWAGAVSNSFQKGTVVSSSRGTYAVLIPTWNKSANLREDLGLPVSSEWTHAVLRVRMQNFERGRLFWYDNHAERILGVFASAYRAADNDGEAAFGLPLADEYVSPSRGVEMQRFSNSTFFVVQGKVAIVQGAIHRTYLGLGLEKSRLGLPLGREQNPAKNQWYSLFEHGRIDWRDGGTHVTYA